MDDTKIKGRNNWLLASHDFMSESHIFTSNWVTRQRVEGWRECVVEYRQSVELGSHEFHSFILQIYVEYQQ